MFKITFEAKNMKDLQTQVNDLCETADAILNEEIDNAILNESKNQQVRIAPVSLPSNVVIEPKQNRITPTPVTPVPAPIDQQPVSTPLPVPAVQVATQESAPISSDLPWDERIHSSSRARTKDGSWKKRRNVSEELYDSVVAELIRGSAPAIVTAVPGPPAPTQPLVVVPALPGPEPLVTESPMITPTAPPAPMAMTPVAQPPVAEPAQVYTPAPVPQSDKQAHNFDTFKSNFAQVMAGLKGQGHLTPEYIGSLNTHFGVSELWELASDDTKLGELFQNFADFGWITKVD